VLFYIRRWWIQWAYGMYSVLAWFRAGVALRRVEEGTLKVVSA
jgi:hypothetical protein